MSAPLSICVEAPELTPDLTACTFHLRGACPQHRETAASIITAHGFKAHVGGRHVAALHPVTGERLLLVTHRTEADWN